MNNFPSPLSDWALQEAEATVNSSRIMTKRVPINIPVDKLGPHIAKVCSTEVLFNFHTSLTEMIHHCIIGFVVLILYANFFSLFWIFLKLLLREW